jgi:CotS family spore coat protein
MQREFVKLLQQSWGCSVKSMRRKRKAFLVETNRGYFYLKEYKSLPRVEWMLSLSHQLREHGFHHTLEYISTTEGYHYIEYEGNYYVAAKPILGRDAQYGSIPDIFCTFKCLSDFHHAARNIRGGPRMPSASVPLLEKWDDRLQRFKAIVEKLNRSRSLSSFEQRMIRFCPYILYEAEEAFDLAQRSPIENEYEQAAKMNCIAHRDLASHNFLIGEHTYLIDYDTALYDTQLVDVVQMLNRILDQQAWNVNLFAHLVNEYQKKVALNDEQCALIYILLRYPDNFMREVIGLYEGKNGFVPNKIEGYLNMIMRQWGERQKFFQGSHHFFHEVPHSPTSIVI